MVQYVASYQYTNMEHVIQMYSAVELWSVIRFYTVQNRSSMEIQEKLRAVYSGLMHCVPDAAHNFS